MPPARCVSLDLRPPHMHPPALLAAGRPTETAFFQPSALSVSKTPTSSTFSILPHTYWQRYRPASGQPIATKPPSRCCMRLDEEVLNRQKPCWHSASFLQLPPVKGDLFSRDPLISPICSQLPLFTLLPPESFSCLSIIPRPTSINRPGQHGHHRLRQ